MTLITKLRYALFSLMLAMAFGFTGVAQADAYTGTSADTKAPETVQWDSDDDEDDDDYDDEDDAW